MEYKSHQYAGESNNSFAVKIENLVREIIIQNDILCYRIESGIEHMTDAGAEENLPVIRIITYFEDTVNKISHILHDEFMVDIEKSVDKKKIRVETFAYKNINYTAQLTHSRRGQTEYKRSADKKFEIQICSMLQDAWSGIEKELGYDSASVPDEAKRDLYRVGALLEMADIEFLKIRTEYSRKKTDKLNEASAPQPAKAAPATAIEPVAENNATTFAEHLQAVAKEVVKEAPVVPAPVVEQPVYIPPPVVAQPVYTPPPVVQTPIVEQPVYTPPPVVAQPVYTPPPVVRAPIVEQPVYNPPPVVEQPVFAPPPVVQAPIVEQPVYTPPPVVQAPVIEQPLYTPPPVVAQPVYTPPPVVELPVYIPPPVVQQPIHTPPPVAQTVAQDPVSAPPVQPIAAQPIATAAPQGLAPKATVIPRPEPVAHVISTGGSTVEQLKELAQSINNNEVKNIVTEIPQPVAEQPKPVMVTPPPVVVETPKPAPAPEVIQPEAVIIPANPVTPVIEMIQPNIISVNGNGIIENVSEPMSEQAPEKAIPLFSEQPKVVKPVQVDDSLQMTDATLREFVGSSKLVKEVDQKIAERAGAKINLEIDIEGDVERLRFLKVYTLKQLQDRISDNKDDIVAFAEKWIGKDNGGSFDSGICLFYLEYLLVGKRNDPAFAVDYVVKFISDNDYSARYIIPTYNSIHNTEAPNFSHLTLRA